MLRKGHFILILTWNIGRSAQYPHLFLDMPMLHIWRLICMLSLLRQDHVHLVTANNKVGNCDISTKTSLLLKCRYIDLHSLHSLLQWRSQGCLTGGASKGQGFASGGHAYMRDPKRRRHITVRPWFFDSVFIETAAGTNALPPKK